MATKTLKVLKNQTIYDLALQEFGSVEGIVRLLQDNPTLSLNKVIQPGTLIKVKGEPINKEVAAFFRANEINIATMQNAEILTQKSFSQAFNYSYN